MSRLYHILCVNHKRVVYEAKILCQTRKAAMEMLREQIGRRSLAGLTYSISEIPVDIIREIVESIIKGKPVKGGVIIPFSPEALEDVRDGSYAKIIDNKYNSKAPREIGATRRRLGDL